MTIQSQIAEARSLFQRGIAALDQASAALGIAPVGRAVALANQTAAPSRRKTSSSRRSRPARAANGRGAAKPSPTDAVIARIAQSEALGITQRELAMAMQATMRPNILGRVLATAKAAKRLVETGGRWYTPQTAPKQQKARPAKRQSPRSSASRSASTNGAAATAAAESERAAA